MEPKAQFPQIEDVCYLDHAGATLASTRQIENHLKLLQSSLLLNPHSLSADDDKGYIDEARKTILSFFRTSAAEYTVIFTSGATESIRRVGEYFDYGDGGLLCYLDDNHTSVLGIREYALARGARVSCVSEDQLNHRKTNADATDGARTNGSCGLFVYPAQSNFSGRKYNLDWVRQLKARTLTMGEVCDEWFVLLDAASLVATSPLTLSNSQIDFVPVSFYKIFGYPTGLGALLVRNSSFHKLKKVYFGGGTVEGVGVGKCFHYPRQDKSLWFEDGTLPYQQISALRFGFQEIASRGGMEVMSAHTYHLAKLTHDTLQAVTHYNGNKLAELYSDTGFSDRRLQGPILSFNLLRSSGSYIGYSEVERMAALYKVVFRTGCVCNVGACQKFLKLSSEKLEENHKLGHKCGGSVDLIGGRPTGAVRVSFGHMSTLRDVEKLVHFLKESFCETHPLTVVDTNKRTQTTILHNLIKLTAINVFPIKSCAEYKVTEWALSDTGLLYDRMWAIVDSANVCLTMKRCTDLRKIRPVINLKEQRLLLTAEGFDDISVALKDDSRNDIIETKFCSVKICGKAVETVDCGKEVSDWISDVLARDGCRLVRQKVTGEHEKDSENNSSQSMANDSQYLLITSDSVLSLCQYITDCMNCFVDADEVGDRFRANFVASGAPADDEISWTDLTINSHEFKCLGECERCSMISVDQHTGDKMKEPLRSLTLRNGAKPMFGIHLCNHNFKSGRVRVGDAITVRRKENVT